jgi:hypothetical protein
MRQRLGGLDEVPAKAIVDPIREGLPHRVGLEVADEPGPLERPPEDPPGLHAGPIAWWNQMDGFEFVLEMRKRDASRAIPIVVVTANDIIGFLNLPDAWQVGFNPSITYDNKATSGNRWNVPIGLAVAKTTKVAGKPVKFQFGAEYSVVSQNDFGQRFMLKLNIIPVIPSLIKNPIFGGN